MNLGSVQGRNLSDEAQLQFRWHGHGQTLGVQEVGCQALRLEPNLVLSAWEAKHPRLDGGTVPGEDDDCSVSGHTGNNIVSVCVYLGPLVSCCMWQLR